MATFTIRTLGIKRVVQRLNRYGFLLQKNLVNAVNTSALNIQKDARKAVVVDTGRLRASIRPDFLEEGTISDIGSELDYAPAVEFGTGPHVTSQGSARFKKSLAVWARRHNVPFGAVLTTIRRQGTPARPYLIPAFEREVPNFLRKIGTGIRRTRP